MENYPGLDDNTVSALTVQNKTSFPLTVSFTGPEDKMLGLDEAGSAQVILQKGTYSVTAEARDSGILPYSGQESFMNDEYLVEFVIDNQGKALFLTLS